jgi:hypothetical protein
MEESKINFQTDVNSALTIKSLEFDMKIAEAEAVVADLKKQKAIFFYESNIQILIEQSKKV